MENDQTRQKMNDRIRGTDSIERMDYAESEIGREQMYGTYDTVNATLDHLRNNEPLQTAGEPFNEFAKRNRAYWDMVKGIESLFDKYRKTTPDMGRVFLEEEHMRNEAHEAATADNHRIEELKKEISGIITDRY